MVCTICGPSVSASFCLCGRRSSRSCSARSRFAPLVFPLPTPGCAMGSVRSRSETGTLYLDFRYQGTRCREQTLLKDTAANRRKMEQVLEKIEAEITLGIFNYRGYFPNSPTADRFEAMARGALPTDAVPKFETFAEYWFEECRIGWKTSYAENVRITLRVRLVPQFGKLGVNCLSKGDILEFRVSRSKNRHPATIRLPFSFPAFVPGHRSG
jgi:hypothetical protein